MKPVWNRGGEKKSQCVRRREGVSAMNCENCGLPEARVKAWVKLRPRESRFTRRQVKPRQLFYFCNDTCALQTMFLQLPTESTRERISRSLHGQAVTFAEYRKKVQVERADQAAP